MTRILRILLAVSAALFLASLTDAGSDVAWGFLKPLSAILFGAFFIGQLLHKEVVKYDQECRVRQAVARAHAAPPPLSKPVLSSPPRSRESAEPVGAH